MTQAQRYWASSIAMDLFVFGMFACWQAGVERAGNVFVFIGWALIVLRFMAALGVNKRTVDKHPRPAGFVYYHAASEIIFMSCMAWGGVFWMAAMTVFSALWLEAARSSAMERAA